MFDFFYESYRIAEINFVAHFRYVVYLEKLAGNNKA